MSFWMLASRRIAEKLGGKGVERKNLVVALAYLPYTIISGVDGRKDPLLKTEY